MENKKIAFLEYLRIFSFINVFNTHIYPNFWQIDTKTHSQLADIWNPIIPFIFSKGTGVITFFLISGYIMGEVIKRESKTEFIIKRITRIYPLYILCVLSQFIISDGAIPAWPELWPRLTLTGDFLHTDQVLNGVDWTLRIEMLFYVYICLIKFSSRKSWLFAFIQVTTIILWQVTPPFPNWEKPTHGLTNIYFPILAAGTLIRVAEEHPSTTFFAIVGNVLAFHQIADNTGLVGLVIFLTVWNYRSKISASFFSDRIAPLTYSVYLTHAWLFHHLQEWVRKYGVKNQPFLDFAAIGLLLTISMLLSSLIERPFIHLAKILVRRKNVSSAVRSRKLTQSVDDLKRENVL